MILGLFEKEGAFAIAKAPSFSGIRIARSTAYLQ